MNNFKNDFNIELNKTRIMLNNIKSMNIDVSSLNQELDNLLISDNSYNSMFQEQFDYNKKVNELRSFQKKLKDFETLFKINNSTTYLNDFIKKELSTESIKKCSDEVIISLDELKNCGFKSQKMDEERDLLLDTVYEVIKLEYIYTGNSNTLNYVVKTETFILDINNRILNEVEKINSSINSIPGLDTLKSVMFERNKMGVEAHYVCEDVFKSLVICTEIDKIKKNMSEALENFKAKIKENYKNLSTLSSSKFTYSSHLKSSKSDRKSYFNDMRNTLIACALTGSILGGGIFALRGPIRKGCTAKEYMTTTSTITLEEGKVDSDPEYQTKINEGYKVELEVSNKYEKAKIKTLIYDVTEMFPQGKEYSFDDFSFLEDMTPTSSETTKKAKGLTEEEIETIKEVYKFIITNQDLEDVNLNFDPVGYWMLIIFLTGFALLIFGIATIFFDIECLPDNIKGYLRHNKDVKYNAKDLKKVINESYELIKSNEKVKQEFLMFYKKNKLVIDEYFASIFKEIDGTLNNNDEVILKLKEK